MFSQIPNDHLQGRGCPKCGVKERTLKNTKPENTFFEKAKEVHGDKYDYTKTEYINTETKVIIICKTHGEFEQSPESHLQGKGCKKCASAYTAELIRTTPEDFIKKAKEIHKNKYNYSKVVYSNSNNKVEIICPIHGSFLQTPSMHLSGQGCKKCGVDKRAGTLRDTTENFIKKAVCIHGSKYNYNLVRYTQNKGKVDVVCDKHGVFSVKPNNHLTAKSGCPKCVHKVSRAEAQNTIFFNYGNEAVIKIYMADGSVRYFDQTTERDDGSTYGGMAFGSANYVDRTHGTIVFVQLFEDRKYGVRLIFKNGDMIQFFE
jgi:hypothetical protein